MPQTLRERSLVDKELRKLGFGGLDDPNLITQIAFLIRDHDHFKRQLFSVEPEQRRHAYACLAPHLNFTPKPLDVYEAEMKRMAEEQQLPVWDGSPYPKEFRVPEIETDGYRLEQLAQKAIKQNAHEKAGGRLELVCKKCTGNEFFPAKTREQAEKDAYSAGWREANGKAYCPKHVPTRLTMKLSCVSCDIVQRIRAWDEQDGYRDARLLGWVIRDGSICPECAAKTIRKPVIQ